jgi:hypothetical protein
MAQPYRKKPILLLHIRKPAFAVLSAQKSLPDVPAFYRRPMPCIIQMHHAHAINGIVMLMVMASSDDYDLPSHKGGGTVSCEHRATRATPG